MLIEMLHAWICLVLVVYLQIKKGPQKGQVQEVIKRKNSLTDIMKISLRWSIVISINLLFALAALWKLTDSLSPPSKVMGGNVFARVCRYMYTYMYIYIYVYIHICIYTYMYIGMFVNDFLAPVLVQLSPNVVNHTLWSQGKRWLNFGRSRSVASYALYWAFLVDTLIYWFMGV